MAYEFLLPTGQFDRCAILQRAQRWAKIDAKAGQDYHVALSTRLKTAWSTARFNAQWEKARLAERAAHRAEAQKLADRGQSAIIDYRHVASCLGDIAEMDRRFHVCATAQTLLTEAVWLQAAE